jgi:hypothetical protein
VVLLVLRRDRRDRLWGLLIGLGLIAKLVLEQPFGPALRSVAGWDIAIAPLAHATGALAGSLCALLVHAARPQRARS